jgi:type II secretory pathway pseudopilin PulG
MNPSPAIRSAPTVRRRSSAAFTMVEIALCIAVVAIAMVAIIGVLPAGLNVQRQNREEALLTQDAELLLNVLRGGQTRLQDLLNFADRVTLVRHFRGGATRINSYHGPLATVVAPDSVELVDAFQLVGLLSRPKYTAEPASPGATTATVVTNVLRLEMRTMSGSMSDHPVVRDGRRRTGGRDSRIDFAFRYLVTIESVVRQPLIVPGNIPAISQDTMGSGVTDIRLTVEWPLFRNSPDPNVYRVGLNRREFRTEVVGTPATLNGNVPGDPNYFGPVVFPFRRPSGTPTPEDVFLYRLLPGAL